MHLSLQHDTQCEWHTEVGSQVISLRIHYGCLYINDILCCFATLSVGSTKHVFSWWGLRWFRPLSHWMRWNSTAQGQQFKQFQICSNRIKRQLKRDPMELGCLMRKFIWQNMLGGGSGKNIHLQSHAEKTMSGHKAPWNVQPCDALWCTWELFWEKMGKRELSHWKPF